MIKKITTTLIMALLCTLPITAGQQDNRKVEGTTKDIKWGQHWAGPNIKNSTELKGKVVLVVIWGG